ncbi:MAG: toprim domain-containing protein [Planctomycetes bacterium]|nr:toprim domain-containing protein [Planctomycetota bacterium]
MNRWIRVTRKKPCPICQKPDWCSVSADGQIVVCMRVDSPRPCRSGGWFHRLDEPAAYQPPPRPRTEAVPAQDFTDLACQCEQRLENIEGLARSLGVSVRSLERLQAGYNGAGYTFPMRDGRERIIGIRVRTSKGKWCVPGSRNGLFWPEGVYSGSDGRLIVCEGPTDCAALLTLEFDALGRPSCQGGVDHITTFLQGRRREVIILADKDPPKRRPDGSVWYPGQEGAARLAQAIRPLVQTLKIVKPPFHKDIRAWLQAGATHDVVEAVIRNTRYIP